MNEQWMRKFMILSNRNDNWITNIGATIVLNPEIKADMTDNGDGTYSYSFTSTTSGKLTVLIYLDNSNNGVYAQFWNSIDLTGSVDKTWWYSTINQFWTPLVTTTSAAPTSGRLTTFLTVPQNDTYTTIKPFIQSLMKLEKSRSSRKFDVN